MSDITQLGQILGFIDSFVITSQTHDDHIAEAAKIRGPALNGPARQTKEMREKLRALQVRIRLGKKASPELLEKVKDLMTDAAKGT